MMLLRFTEVFYRFRVSDNLCTPGFSPTLVICDNDNILVEYPHYLPFRGYRGSNYAKMQAESAFQEPSALCSKVCKPSYTN